MPSLFDRNRPSGTVFCLDTSAWIESWHRRYPIDVFPKFWNAVDAWIDDGKVVAPEEVLRELEKIEDELYKWAKQRKDKIFRPPDEDVQRAIKRILATYRRLVDSKRGRSIADPWVIAQAQVSHAVVVSEEPRTGTTTSPKIPDVCDALGIKHINVLGFIREMGLSF